jgi:hypothetical protein
MVTAKTRKLSDGTIQVYALQDGKEISGSAHNLFRYSRGHLGNWWRSDSITGEGYKTITEWKIDTICRNTK